MVRSYVEFEGRRIDVGSSRHADHLKVMWGLIQAYGFEDAISSLVRGLRELNAAHGLPSKYHATITYFFAFCVAEQIHARPGETWEDFAASQAGLFEWPNRQLQEAYPNGELATELARRTFLLPRPRDGALHEGPA
jgi:hypothetical protein